MKRELFRESAMKQISTPDNLDQILTVTRPRDWIALSAIAIILASAVLWAEYGRISKKVEGQGVLVLTGGVVNVFADGGGRVRDLHVNTGDWVEKNQSIGTVSQVLLDNRLKALRENLAEVEGERVRARVARFQGLKLQGAAIEDRRQTLKGEVADEQQQIQIIDEQSRVDDELLAKGLITRQTLLSTRQRRMGALSNIAKLEAQMKDLDSNRFQNEASAVQADREADARVSELQRSISLLVKEIENASVIRSPYSGKVTEVKVYPGALVNPGEAVVSLEPAAGSVEVILYVASTKVKEIRPGMDVEVAPASIPREEFGFMRATVTSVAEFPATRAAVLRNFENDSLVNALAASGPVNEVRVQLHPNPRTLSGFEWSSSQGPRMRISSGTLCAAEIVTRRDRPISLVVPYFEHQAGVN